jgi:succinylglutamate desuccinylase
VPRVLGRWGQAGPGQPLLVVFGGLHGNEPAGVLAAERVLARLGSGAIDVRGEVVFVAGNRGALARGVRFVDRDLNRAWTPGGVARLRIAAAEGPGPSADREDEEQRELLEVIDELTRTSSGAVYALDLHTTSGAGGAFVTTADSLDNRDLAQALRVPLVLGLEELLDGTLHDYLDRRGCITVAFEAGQHDDLRSVDRAEAAVWLTLATIGMVSEARCAEVGTSRRRLDREGLRHPPVLEMRHRHGIAPDDQFRMDPGYQNFSKVQRGQGLARDRHGRVRAPERGRILMPLYQAQGNDGYFLVREFRPVWLHLSRVLRGLGADRWVHWLPGVRMSASDRSRLVINRRVARWFALQVLHLVGYRRMRQEGDELVVLRHPDHPGARRAAERRW